MLDSMTLWISLVFWTLIWGGIGGMIGGRLKGRPTAGAFMGAVFGPLGLLMALAMGSDLATCPECKSKIPQDARRCRYCQVSVEPKVIVAQASKPKPRPPVGYRSAAAAIEQKQMDAELGIDKQTKVHEADIDSWLNDK